MKTLLLAEHHAPTLAHVRAELTQAGYSVIPASDPGSALEAFVAKHPDAVVVAVDFPRLDGAHLGQRIRSHDRGARVPVIAIDKAHLGRAKGVQAILELKVNGYVPDPLKSAELAGKLQQLLASAEQAASSAAQSSGARAVLDRKPISSGELKGHALPALVHSLFRLQRDGVLVVAFKDLTRRAYFLRGGAVNYDSTARQDSFASFLLERQLIQPGEGEALMKALSGGLRIGSALAEAGIRLEGEELLGALRDYTREKITQLVGMRDGRYAFHAGAEFSAEVPTIEIPTLSAVLEGARRSFPVRQFAQGLKDKLDQFPARTPQFGQDLGAMGLGTQDIKVAMQVNGRLVLRDLIAHGRGELRETYSLFWFLGLTGAVSFSKEPTAAGDAQTYVAADAIAPRKKKPLPPETVRELRDAAVKIITASYFRVLGLSIDADTEAVERAYHEVAAKFHPDSYPGQDTSELQDLLDSVQDKLAASLPRALERGSPPAVSAVPARADRHRPERRDRPRRRARAPQGRGRLQAQGLARRAQGVRGGRLPEPARARVLQLPRLGDLPRRPRPPRGAGEGGPEGAPQGARAEPVPRAGADHLRDHRRRSAGRLVGAAKAAQGARAQPVLDAGQGRAPAGREVTMNAAPRTAILKQLWRASLKHRRLLGLAALAMVALGVTTGAYAWLMGPALRFLLTGGKDGLGLPAKLFPMLGGIDRARALWLFPVVIVVIGVIKGFAYLGQFYWMGLYAQRVVQDLRREVFIALSRLSPTQRAARLSGDLLTRFSADVAAVELAATYAVGSYVRDGLQVVILVGVALALDWKLALGTLVVVPLAAWPVSRLTRSVLKRTREAQGALGQLAGQISEGLGGLRTIQAFNGQPAEARRFSDVTSRHQRAVIRAGWTRGAVPGLMEILAAGAIASALTFAASTRSVPPEHLVSLLTALVLIYQPAKDLGRVSQFAIQASAAGERIFELLELPEAVPTQPGATAGAAARAGDPLLRGRVLLRRAGRAPGPRARAPGGAGDRARRPERRGQEHGDADAPSRRAAAEGDDHPRRRRRRAAHPPERARAVRARHPGARCSSRTRCSRTSASPGRRRRSTR